MKYSKKQAYLAEVRYLQLVRTKSFIFNKDFMTF